ncbi:MAG: hypothetical protein U9Q18_06200 [Caldisericota bacterium]|nr:hypothetical protein [Caldisericota bacterium]
MEKDLLQVLVAVGKNSRGSLHGGVNFTQERGQTLPESVVGFLQKGEQKIFKKI